jgi:hypothetical protein
MNILVHNNLGSGGLIGFFVRFDLKSGYYQLASAGYFKKTVVFWG